MSKPLNGLLSNFGRNGSITILQPGKKNYTFPLNLRKGKCLLIGRTKGCNIRILRNDVSRRHGKFVCDEKGLVYFVPTSFKQPSYLNKEFVDARFGPQQFINGDLLVIGGKTFLYTANDLTPPELSFKTPTPTKRRKSILKRPNTKSSVKKKVHFESNHAKICPFSKHEPVERISVILSTRRENFQKRLSLLNLDQPETPINRNILKSMNLQSPTVVQPQDALSIKKKIVGEDVLPSITELLEIDNSPNTKRLLNLLEKGDHRVRKEVVEQRNHDDGKLGFDDLVYEKLITGSVLETQKNRFMITGFPQTFNKITRPANEKKRESKDDQNSVDMENDVTPPFKPKRNVVKRRTREEDEDDSDEVVKNAAGDEDKEIVTLGKRKRENIESNEQSITQDVVKVEDQTQLPEPKKKRVKIERFVVSGMVNTDDTQFVRNIQIRTRRLSTRRKSYNIQF